MPDSGKAAVAWLTKQLGKPTKSNRSCPRRGAKYYAWNNFRVIILTKDIDYEPEPFRAGTVGGWNAILHSDGDSGLVGYRISGQLNKPDTYLTTGLTISQALKVFPEAESEVSNNRKVIDYFAGDITNIRLESAAGDTTNSAKIHSASAGVGSVCG